MPFAAKPIARTWQDHFLESVLVGDGCWGWLQGHNPEGYAMWQPSGEFAVQFGTAMRQMAYRVMWELLRGPIPEGLDIDHMCRMKGCINPDHLDPVTRQVNLRRAGVLDNRQHRPRIFCKYGHKLSETRLTFPNGRSCCGVCRAAWVKNHYQAKKAKRIS